MRTLRVVFAVSLLAVGVTAVAHGREAGRPLVVAVDAAPGAAVDAAQVRAVIGRELVRPIVAFTDGATSDEGDLLLVGVNRERIVLSLRRSAEETVARSVPAPADEAARLRAIAWLAGNVARDQVSPFLQSSADLANGGLRADAVAREPDAPAPAPPSVATEPPPVASPPLPLTGPVETLDRAASGRAVPDEAPWTAMVAGGVAYFVERAGSFNAELPKVFQLELVRHRPDRVLWGVAADLGPFPGAYGGVAAIGGIEGRWGKLRLEGTVGLGVESGPMREVTTTIKESSQTPQSETTVTIRTGIALYSRGFVTLARELTPSWDLVLRVGGQVPFAETYGGPGVTTALGVRFNAR